MAARLRGCEPCTVATSTVDRQLLPVRGANAVTHNSGLCDTVCSAGTAEGSNMVPELRGAPYGDHKTPVRTCKHVVGQHHRADTVHHPVGI
jgi:hypothetical protein